MPVFVLRRLNPPLKLPAVYTAGFFMWIAAISGISGLVMVLSLSIELVLLYTSLLVLAVTTIIFVPKTSPHLSWSRLCRPRRFILWVLMLGGGLFPLGNYLPMNIATYQTRLCPVIVQNHLQSPQSGVDLTGIIKEAYGKRYLAIYGYRNHLGVTLKTKHPWLVHKDINRNSPRLLPLEAESFWAGIRSSAIITLFRVFPSDENTQGSRRIHPAGFLSGIVFGDRGHISPQLQLLFRQVGVLHILALSGFHLGLLSSLLNRFCGVFSKKGLWASRISSLFIILVCSLFCLIAIPGPGLFRAGLMLLIRESIHLFRRPGSMDTTFFLSAAILLGLNPWFLVDWGFYLTYLALWGLMKAQGGIQANLRLLMGKILAAYVSSSLAAVWWTIPFFLITNGEVSLNGILVSPVVGILIAIWIYLGMFVVLIIPILPGLLPITAGIGDLLSAGTDALLLHGRLIPILTLTTLGGRLVCLSLWFILSLLLWYHQTCYPRMRYDSIQLTPGTLGSSR